MSKIHILLIFVFLLPVFSPAYSAETEKEPLTLEEALKIYSTPFIDDYRARYKASSYRGGIIIIAQQNCTRFPNSKLFKIPCMEKDIENIKKLAAYGDGPSLKLAFYFVNSDIFNNYIKHAANIGIPEGLILYWSTISNDELVIREKHLKKLKFEGYIEAYQALAGVYSNHKMIKEFCDIMDEGYKKFGFGFIAINLLLNKPREKPSIYEQYPQICIDKTADEFLDEINTDESKLVKASRYIRNKKYKQAKDLYQEIYDKADNNDLKQNAGFCLGAMYYSGTAVKKNKEYGMKLMKDAVNAGYVTFFDNLPELRMMPDRYEMINPYNKYCETLI